MALNLSRIFKGRTPAEGVVTDNVDPDELGVSSVDGKFGPETDPSVVSLDVWEHASSVPGGTAAANVVGLGKPAGLPGNQAADAGSETARSMQSGVFDDSTGAEGVHFDDTASHLEQDNGGLDTTDEAPQFADSATARSMQPGPKGWITDIGFPAATGPTEGSPGGGPAGGLVDTNSNSQGFNVKWEGPDFDATAGQSALQRNAAPGTPFFDEADALFGRAPQNLTAQYNPKEMGIDKVQMLNNKNPDLTLRDASGDLHVGGSGVDGARRGGDVQFEDVHVSLIDVEGSRPADLEVLAEPGNTQNPGSGIHDIHPNQGNNYTATDDLWKFRGEAQDGSGTDNANRSMQPGQQGDEGTGSLLSSLDAGRREGPGWYVPEMDSDQSGMAMEDEPPARWVNSVEFPNLKAESEVQSFESTSLQGTSMQGPGYTATDDLWKFRGDAQDGSGTDNANRSMQPGQPGDGFMMQDGELYPRGLRDMEIELRMGSGKDASAQADDSNRPHESLSMNIRETALGGPDTPGYTATDDLWKFREDSAGDETSRSMALGQPGDGFMMQDGELYPRGLRDMEIQMATSVGGPESGDSGGPLFRSGVAEPALGGPDTPGYTATDDLWKFREDSAGDETSRSMQPGQPGDGFMMQDGELYPRGLRDMEIELRMGSGKDASAQADDSNRPHESLSMNIRETALGGSDTTERFKVEIEGVAFTNDGSGGGENARSAGPGAPGFRPNPTGDGTTQHFQAMPDLDASGNSVVDAADYTVWRDNLRGSNPPEGLLPYIEQSNLVGGARFNGSEDQLKTLMGNLQQKGLIDTSTGEILWASGEGSQTQASDSELAALVAWLRSTQPPGGAGPSEFYRFEGLPGEAEFIANASKNELSIETIEIEEGGGSRHARVVDYREGGLNDSTHRLADEDGPSTFLDALGDGAKTTDATSLKVEWITSLHAGEHDQTDHDFGVDALDADVDVP